MTEHTNGRDRVLVVVPVMGHHEMTHDLVGDLAQEADLVDVVIVDNGGDYPAVGDETVVRPPANLGWAGGTNYGTEQQRRSDHAAFVWLNNDTRLSAHHVAGLQRAWKETGAALVGPVYDCHWAHQCIAGSVAVDRYRPRNVHFRAPFLDGTCMFVPATTVDAVGLLDADTFGPAGWGAEIDYGLRVRAAGGEVAVTRLAYLHHEKGTTAKTVFGGELAYAEQGHPAALAGLHEKWGADWQRAAGIDPVTFQTRPPGRKERFSRRVFACG